MDAFVGQVLEPEVGAGDGGLVGTGQEDDLVARSEDVGWRSLGRHADQPAADGGGRTRQPARHGSRAGGRHLAAVGTQEFQGDVVAFEAHQRGGAAGLGNLVGKLRGPETGHHGHVAHEDGGDGAEARAILRG